MGQYNIKYKTFNQLLAEVKSDFESYNLEDMIKPYQLIKVAKRVTYDLGLRIYKTKNAVLEVDHGKAKLPDDFNVMNYLYILGNYQVTTPVAQGTHVEQVPLNAPTYFPGVDKISICATPEPCPISEPVCPDLCQSPEPCGCKTCGCNTWINCKGQEMELIQKIKMETRTWTEFYRIKLTGNDRFFDPMCPNNRWQASNTAFIEDGFIYTSFKTGTLYINYQGMMEDEDGNLLVLEHDMINEYYEYALKERILEILMGNNETVNGNFVQRIDQKLKLAKNAAKSIVNTPDFGEIKGVYDMNRKAMFNKYYKMFI